MKITKYLILILQLAITFILGFGLLYVRLIPRVSRDLWENMSQQQILLTSITLLLLFINIYHWLKMLEYIKTGNSTIFNCLKKIVSVPINFIIDSLETTYNRLWYLIQYIANKLNYPYAHYNSIRIFLYKFNRSKYWTYYVLILLSLRYLPRIFLVLALFVDVIINRRFDYTFRCIPWLLLPLVEKFIIFVFRDFIYTHFEDVVNVVKVTPCETPETYFFYYDDKVEEALLSKIGDFLVFFEQHYLVMLNLQCALNSYYEFTKFYIFELFLTSFRFSIYLFVLYYGLC